MRLVAHLERGNEIDSSHLLEKVESK